MDSERAELARLRGVSHATLYKWKRGLGAAGSASRCRFVELVPTPSSGAGDQAPGARADSGVELRVGCELRLTIARDFDPQTLRRVVEALTGELAR